MSKILSDNKGIYSHGYGLMLRQLLGHISAAGYSGFSGSGINLSLDDQSGPALCKSFTNKQFNLHVPVKSLYTVCMHKMRNN